MEKNRLLEINIGMNPTRVELELTEQCNLKCKFCYNSQNPLISDKIFDVIERLHEMGVLEIILTGGEPISHPLFLDILDKCCKYFDKVMVQTNGTLIDAGMAKTLKNKGVYGVNVSLHGDKELHEKLTLVDGSYIQAYEALEHLASEGVNTASNFVLTTENISAFPKTIKKLHDIGVNGMTLTRFTPTGIGADNAYLSISTDQLVKVLEQADSFLENFQFLCESGCFVDCVGWHYERDYRTGDYIIETGRMDGNSENVVIAYLRVNDNANVEDIERILTIEEE